MAHGDSLESSNDVGRHGVDCNHALGAGIQPQVAQADDSQEDDGSHKKYTIALWGDMPYNALGKQQYPARCLPT
jgi:hypothetical protein